RGQSAARAFPYWRQERSSASRMLFGVDTCEPWCLQFAWVLLRRVGPEPMAIEKRIHAWHRSSEESRPFLKGSDEHVCTPVTYVPGSMLLCELIVLEEPSLRRPSDTIGGRTGDRCS